jgi:hypothetical protein
MVQCCQGSAYVQANDSTIDFAKPALKRRKHACMLAMTAILITLRIGTVQAPGVSQALEESWIFPQVIELATISLRTRDVFAIFLRYLRPRQHGHSAPKSSSLR